MSCFTRKSWVTSRGSRKLPWALADSIHCRPQFRFCRNGEQSHGGEINVHLDLLGSLVLAVDFDAADQRVDDFRRELPDVRIIPQRLHQQP